MKNLILKYTLVTICFITGMVSSVTAQTDTLDLEYAVQAALQNNNLYRIKQLQAAEIDAKIREADIKKYPAVMLNSTYQYNFNIGELTIPQGSLGSLPLNENTIVALPAHNLSFPLGANNVFNAGVTAYQPITQLGKIKTGVDVSKTDHAIALIEQNKAGIQITSAVEQLYYGILIIRKRMEEAEKNIEVAKLKLYDVQSALLSGKTLEVNEAGLYANIAGEEQELLKLSFQEEDYIAAFGNLTGLNVAQMIFSEQPLNTDEQASLEAFQQAAARNNTDIQLAGLQRQKTELGILAARQSNLPDIGIMAGYTFQEGNVLFPRHNPFIGASLKWNIQDLFSNKQVMHQRKFVQQQAEENEIYTRKQTSEAVEKAYRKMRQATELIGVAAKAAAYRQQELKIEKDKSEAGMNTPLKVLEAEAANAKAQADWYAARLNYKIALSELKSLTEPAR